MQSLLDICIWWHDVSVKSDKNTSGPIIYSLKLVHVFQVKTRQLFLDPSATTTALIRYTRWGTVLCLWGLFPCTKGAGEHHYQEVGCMVFGGVYNHRCALQGMHILISSFGKSTGGFSLI